MVIAISIVVAVVCAWVNKRVREDRRSAVKIAIGANVLYLCIS